jgi:NAD(P)-dependent dehydrogenase (short-subunit alcohol dehydrogenase family)
VTLTKSTELGAGTVVFDDIDYRFRGYDPLSAYAQSKTAEILFAVGATQRWANEGVFLDAVNPGVIATGLQRHVGGELATPVDERPVDPQQLVTTVATYALDPEGADRLWNVSERFLG